MATSAEILCEICEGQNIRKEADNWCPECEGGLCSECEIHHSISKLTKKHALISIENFKKLPQDIISISNHCKVHDKVYTNYCPDHECLCCPVGMTTYHKQCVNMLMIDDIVKTAKSSALLESLQENIILLKQKLTQILAQHDEMSELNQHQRDDFLAEVKKIKKSLNDHFEELERKITKDITAVEEKIKLDGERFSVELKEKQNTLEKLEVDISSVKQYASDLQTCLGCMTFKTKVEQVEKYLTSLQETMKLKKISFKHNPNEKNIDMTTAFTTFGIVSVDEIPLEVNLVDNRQRAQILSRPRVSVSKSINDIKVTLKSTWEVPGEKNEISGCVIRPDGKIVIVDRGSNNILIFSENGKLEKELQFQSESKPTDVAFVDDRIMCVSFFDNRLELIDTVTYKTTKVITNNNPCCGVAPHKGNLIWYENFKGIQMKQKNSDSFTTLVKDERGYYWSYLTVHDNRIYQAFYYNNTVICYTIKGEKVWEFNDEKVIASPTGIAVDYNGNIYVASRIGKVVILSPDGKNFRQLLGKDDGMKSLCGIFFDKSRSCLLVVNKGGEVFIYNVF